jgi:osmotically-inducible protein OsmY
VISDRELKRQVEAELRWSPRLNESEIEVSVRNAPVTLRGFAHSYADKYDAEEAVKRISGIAGVANDIEVRPPSTGAESRRR